MIYLYRIDQNRHPQGVVPSLLQGTDGNRYGLVIGAETIPADFTTLQIGSVPDADVLALVPGIVAAKAVMIRAAGALALRQIAGQYMDEERETWEQQRREAAELMADPTSAAPMLTAMAAARGIPVELLAGYINANAAAWPVAAGQILGIQQGLLDRLYAAEPLTVRLGLTWPAAS